MESIAHDLLHCKICIQVLYEPFINPCGHTYCYSCLVQWFDNDAESRRLTCPECRKNIETEPAPNYIVRQMVHKLIQQPQFSEDGETPESHKRAQLEEAAIVERDRASPSGLFKGRFNLPATRSRIAPIHDVEDGVERCPHCAWEIEDDSDVCAHCGIPIDDDYTDDSAAHAMVTDDLGFDSAIDEDDDQDVEDVDADFDLDAGLTEQLGLRGGSTGFPASRPGFVPARSLGPYSVSINVGDRYLESFDSERSSDTGMGYAEDEEGDSAEDEDEDEDDDTSMDGFIDPDEEEESGSDASSTSSSSPPPESEAADYEDTNEEGSDDEELVTPTDTPAPVPAATVRQNSNANKRQRGARPVVIESSDDESEDEGGPVRARRRQWGTAARPVSIDV